MNPPKRAGRGDAGGVRAEEAISPWFIATVAYGTLAFLTALPVLFVILRGVKLNPGGSSFEESPLFSAFTAILLAFHKALKVDANYKAFRQGESDFYDTYRRMLDRPETFGRTEERQLDVYFDTIENLRKFIRNAEIDNIPSLDQAKTQLSHEVPSRQETHNEEEQK
jgi:hypothetical protein